MISRDFDVCSDPAYTMRSTRKTDWWRWFDS